MTTNASDAPADTAPRWARVTSEILAPWILAAVMPPLIAGMTTTPWWRGVLLGLMVTVISAGVPYTVVAVGVRRGRYADHHVSNRADRPALLGIAVAATIASFALLVLLDGSRQVLALMLLMVACVAVGMVISRWWKVSLHSMVVAASVTVLVGLEPWTFPVVLAWPAVAAARVSQRAHTIAQVVTGGSVGVALALAALWKA